MVAVNGQATRTRARATTARGPSCRAACRRARRRRFVSLAQRSALSDGHGDGTDLRHACAESISKRNPWDMHYNTRIVQYCYT